MKTSLKGLVELAGHEGLCLEPYLDSVGVWTIGVGATKSEIPNLDGSHKEITIQEAIDLFKRSIVKYENAVNKALKVEISQEQFDALVSICYNIGVGGLTKSTFMKRINAKMSNKSIEEAIMMWTKPPEITKRRQREAKLYTQGVYSNNGLVLVFPVSVTHKPLYSRGHILNIMDMLK